MADRSKVHLVRNDDTPPESLPVIRERTTFRTDIKSAIAVIAAAVVFATWLTVIYVNQLWILQAIKSLQDDVRSMKEEHK